MLAVTPSSLNGSIPESGRTGDDLSEMIDDNCKTQFGSDQDYGTNLCANSTLLLWSLEKMYARGRKQMEQTDDITTDVYGASSTGTRSNAR